MFLEVGPGRTLTAVGTETARGGERWVAPLRRGREWRATLEALAVLYVAGVEVAWAAYDAPYARRRVGVPTYPFQRQRYWFDSDLTAGAVTQTTARRGAIASPEEAAGHPLLGARVRAAVPTTLYESQWSLTTRPYVSEHRVYGAAVVPATAYVALVVAAATETAGGSTGGVVVEDLRLEAALALEAAPAVTVQVVVTPGEAESHEVQVLSLAAAGAAAGGRWRRHARAQVRLGPSTAPGSEAGASLEAVRARCQEVVAVPTLYADLAARGVTYGPLFRGLVGVWHGEAGEALGEVAVPVPLTGDAGWLHPAVLDATWQVLGAGGWPARTADGDDVYVPVGVERVHVVGPVRGGRVWAHAVRRPGASDRIVVGDVWVWDAAGQPVGVVEGITLQRVSRAQLLGEGSAVALADGRYEVVWRARPGREGAAGTADAAWLIVADRGGVGAAVAARLTQHGARCTTVDSDDDAAVEAALASSACSGVVHLGSLDVVADATATGAAVVAEQARGCGSVLRVVQALARGTTPAARVWVATQGAQAVTAGAAVAVAQAPAWGLGRVIALEHPELWGGLVDLDPAAPPMDAGAALAEAVLAADGEDQIALRGATRYVARLTRRPAPAIPSSGDEAVQLQVGTPGLLETLRLVPVPRRPPGPREVEIRVTAAGLNFLDVLSALGTLPIDRPGPLGHECAGEVVAVGAGVTDLATGDHVVALAAGCFGGYATTAADFVVRRPEGLTAENAASLPVAYLTARYGLEVLADLRAGERVLIHAAAGGVGLAAVAVAQRIGAEVFATAGSAEKRAYLLGLGVRHVFDSRSLAFEGDVLAATGGTGVDVVLNSLAGEFIGASVRVLAPQGRFLEIGKRGVWDAAQIAAVRPGARCHVYRPCEARGQRAAARASVAEGNDRRRRRGTMADAAARDLCAVGGSGGISADGAGASSRQAGAHAACERRASGGARRRDVCDYRRVGRPGAGGGAVAGGAGRASSGADGASRAERGGAAGRVRAGRRRGARARRARRRGAGRGRRAAGGGAAGRGAAAGAWRGARGGHAGRRRGDEPDVGPLCRGAGGEGGGQLGAAPATAARAARLVRPLLVVGRDPRLARPGQSRGGQCVSRCAGA